MIVDRVTLIAWIAVTSKDDAVLVMDSSVEKDLLFQKAKVDWLLLDLVVDVTELR